METVKLWKVKNPIVVAITLIYNKLDFCKRAVESFLNFNGLEPENLRYILWDQGAPYPDVKEWLDGMRQDERVEVWGDGVNIGVGAALNAVIESTESAYVYKFDDDNEFLPHTLPGQLMAYILTENAGFPLGVLSADVVGVGKANGPYYEVEILPGMMLQCSPCVGGGACLYSRKILNEIGPFRADRLYGVEDGDFASKAVKKGYHNAYLKDYYHISYCRGEEADPEIDRWKLEYTFGRTSKSFEEWRNDRKDIYSNPGL